MNRISDCFLFTLGSFSVALPLQARRWNALQVVKSSLVFGPTSMKFSEKNLSPLSLSLPLHSFESKLLQDVTQHSQEYHLDHSDSLYASQARCRFESHFRTRSRGLDKPNFTSQLPPATTRGDHTPQKLDHRRTCSHLRSNSFTPRSS